LQQPAEVEPHSSNMQAEPEHPGDDQPVGLDLLPPSSFQAGGSANPGSSSSPDLMVDSPQGSAAPEPSATAAAAAGVMLPGLVQAPTAAEAAVPWQGRAACS
jgi:hypothetical protein